MQSWCEVDKLREVGESIGLSGTDLKEWILDQQVKWERADADRRADELKKRDDEQKAREYEERRREYEERKLAGERDYEDKKAREKEKLIAEEREYEDKKIADQRAYEEKKKQDEKEERKREKVEQRECEEKKAQREKEERKKEKVEREKEKSEQKEYEEKKEQREKEEREKEKVEREKEKAEKRECEEKKEQRERDERQFEASEREKVRLHEIEVLKLSQAASENTNNNNNNNAVGHSGSTSSMLGRTPSFNLGLPPFDESKNNFDAYVLRFEHVAESQRLEKDAWATALSTCLRDEALEVYYRMPPTEIRNYDALKSALNDRYGLSEEEYKHSFMGCKPQSSETCKQFVTRLEHYLNRWWDMAAIEKTLQGVTDLLLRNQLGECCSRELIIFLREHNCKSIAEMVELADTFVKAHDGEGLKRGENGNAQSQDKIDYRRDNPANKENPRQACYICGSQQHLARMCTKTKQPRQMMGQAMMPVRRGLVGQKDVSVLRDSGCSGVVVRRSLVHDDQLTGEYLEIVMIDGTTRCAPEAVLSIDTPYYVGSVNAVCFENPLFDVIVGNVEGVKEDAELKSQCESEGTNKAINASNNLVMAVDDVQKMDKNGLNLEPIIDADPYIEATVPNEEGEILDDVINEDMCFCGDNEESRDMSNTVGVCRPQEEDVHVEYGMAVETRAEVKQRRVLKPLILPTEIGDVNVDDFKADQENDPSLNRMRSKIGSQHRYPVVMKAGLMYRNFTDKSKMVTSQLIVPENYRNSVLKIGHECIMSGHLGVRKTREKILTQFHWPGVYEDVARYVRSCDACQRTVSKGSVTKIPLGRMPIIDTPFKRIAVDLIGPIEPMSERRNRYILTVVDYATRYPEAIALPNIQTVTVAEALVEIFCRVGVPSEILSDRGSQFVSELMREISRMLSIRQLTTTPYHPACNGLVERFNGTLKQMLRRMCEERPKDWDRFLGPALFAYREAPQESLGFSPFELLQGRTVTGPMTVLKSLFTGDVENDEIKTTYQYVVDLKERLEKTCKLAQDALHKASTRYKKYYDTKSKDRHMNVGDKVLLLLPTNNNKLVMKWRGPYAITQKLGMCDYRVKVGNEIKTFHANMLKHYHERVVGPKKETRSVQCCATLFAEGNEDLSSSPQIMFPPLVSTQNTDDVKICGDLTQGQQDEVRVVLNDFENILTDLPGKTTLIEYDIKLTTNEPVRQKPYPVPHAVKSAMEEEVQSMLKMDIIEPSTSSYNSPVVLVRKPDGTNRFCVDYRKLNRVTVFDTEPIPSSEELFATLTHDKYFTKLDLTKGYWQVPLSKNMKDKTSFSCSSGSYRFKFLPFGLVCAPAVFTKMMRLLLADLNNVDNYIDDVLIHTETWEEHLAVLRQVLDRLKKANLTIKPSKCHVGFSSIEFLGHSIGNGSIRPLTTTMEKIEQSERPTTKTQVRAFLGLTGYYRKYIPNYAAVAVPLTDLTRKCLPKKIQWGEAQEKAFRHLKHLLSTEPILRLPDFQRPFIVRTDASDVGVGAVLLQKDGDELFPVSYASRKLLPRERNYSVIERECLGIVWGIEKFHVFLYGKEFTLQTDHKPLSFMNQSKQSNSRVLRWALALQEYRFNIQDIRGVENHCADYLSRIDT